MNETNRNAGSIESGFNHGDRVRPNTHMTIPLERYLCGEVVLEGPICIGPSHMGTVIHDPKNTTSTVVVVKFDFEGIVVPGELYIPSSKLTKVYAGAQIC